MPVNDFNLSCCGRGFDSLRLHQFKGKNMNKLLFHRFIRWALGIHGSIHIFETLLNVYEQAYMSALLSLLAGLLMIAGACIDSGHHKGDDE